MNSDNPAARLLSILKEGLQQGTTTNCRHVWETLLEVDKNNQALLMKRLGKLMELAEEIIQNIKEKHPTQLEAQTHWNSAVSNAFMSQNLTSNWASFISHIDHHTINYLNMANALLASTSDTKCLPDDELLKIRTDVNDLLSKVIESDVDNDFKKQITYYLHKILIATDEYHISGSKAITESLESALGHAFLDVNYRDTIKSSEIGKDILSVMTGIASSISVINGLPSLEGSLQYLLQMKN